ncbi:MAG: hypothetical protein GKR89_22155 [Candidatus Latescibacteria bacterium]|nr:hypothetical protein [Candidatus Latescibacterota bacterium]
MRAGTAKVDITPQPAAGAFMTGYTSKLDMPAEGAHDALYARILLLDDNAVKVGLIGLDLIGLNPGRLPQLAQALGIDVVLLAATHTHGGPLVLDLGVPYGENRHWPQGAPYLDWLEERIVEGLSQALDALQPVRLGVGRGLADISFNRRQMIDGKVEMVWGKNRDRSKVWGPVDREVGVVRLDAIETGQPLALLANYACHPVVMGPKNRLLTADFPGATCRYLEAKFPGTLPIFLQGGCGDLDPYIDVQGDFEPVQVQGEELGQAIEAVFEQMDAGGAAIEAAPKLKWQALSRTFARFEDENHTQDVHFGVLQIGEQLALVVLPGEPFVGLQLDLKKRSPVPYTFMLGYTNGYVGYFPTRQANREGGYGANRGETMHVEPGAGETMIAAVIKKLEK